MLAFRAATHMYSLLVKLKHRFLLVFAEWKLWLWIILFSFFFRFYLEVWFFCLIEEMALCCNILSLSLFFHCREKLDTGFCGLQNRVSQRAYVLTVPENSSCRITEWRVRFSTCYVKSKTKRVCFTILQLSVSVLICPLLKRKLSFSNKTLCQLV